MSKITALPNTIKDLPPADKEHVEQLFSVDVSTGRLVLPDAMTGWVEDTFGSTSAVTEQRIVRVRNKLTGEEALYNELRAKRPLTTGEGSAREEIENSRGGPFCTPQDATPEDVFGRVTGEHGTTASNIAKYDKHHGLIVFDEHDPLAFTEDAIVDYVRMAGEWYEKAHEHDSNARYPLLVWHCLWKSAASIVHGHMQLLLASEQHYPYAQALRTVQQERPSYFSDHYRAHSALGLGLETDGVRVMADLVPKKEKGILLYADAFDESFARALYTAASTLRDDLGVESFTVGTFLPPLDESWEKYPVVCRLADRGSLSDKTADIGAMELFAGASVIASDPYRVFDALEKRF